MPNDGQITDASASAIQRLRDLVRHPRQGTKQTIVEDEEPVINCSRFGLDVIEVFVEQSHQPSAAFLEECAQRNVPVRSLAESVNIQIFKNDRRPHVYAVIRLPTAPKLDQILARPGDIVLLDGVRIVGNIGAIVRSAFALNAAGVILVDSGLETVADRRLLRASRCYVFALPVAIADQAVVARWLEANQIKPLLMEAGGSIPIDQLARLDGRVALVFGSERRGLSGEFLDIAQGSVSIPMRAEAESLNVSVSVGIGLYARSQQR
jgi:TrmH family RNA methyltransferase